MYHIFGIPDTSQYLAFVESKKTASFIATTPVSVSLAGYEINYLDNYYAELKDIFNYSIYEEEDQCIIKLKMDYIKHNSVVAFPSVLFLNKDIDIIKYTITSKNSPSVVMDELIVEPLSTD